MIFSADVAASMLAIGTAIRAEKGDESDKILVATKLSGREDNKINSEDTHKQV